MDNRESKVLKARKVQEENKVREVKMANKVFKEFKVLKV
jgi:hypothetical protein